MHHKLMHNELLKEEAKALVVEVEPELGELDNEEEFHIASLEDPGQCKSGESEGNESERETQSPLIRRLKDLAFVSRECQ